MSDVEDYEETDGAVTTHPATAEEAQAFTSGSEPAGVNVIADEADDEDATGDEETDQDEDGDQDDDQRYDQLRSRRKAPVADPPSSGLVAEIKNMTATVNLDATIDLKTVALHARNAEYNPKRFSAVIMRIREPKATALIFSTGKMVVTGCKSENDAKLAGRKFTCIIQKLGFQPKFKDFKMQNIVGIVDCGFPIKLDNLANSHDKFSSYEPEIFPGLIYRMMQPRIVLLIFVSGKIVITGAKTREDIYTGFELMYPVLSTFRKWIQPIVSRHATRRPSQPATSPNRLTPAG